MVADWLRLSLRGGEGDPPRCEVCEAESLCHKPVNSCSAVLGCWLTGSLSPSAFEQLLLASEFMLAKEWLLEVKFPMLARSLCHLAPCSSKLNICHPMHARGLQDPVPLRSFPSPAACPDMQQLLCLYTAF